MISGAEEAERVAAKFAGTWGIITKKKIVVKSQL